MIFILLGICIYIGCLLHIFWSIKRDAEYNMKRLLINKTKLKDKINDSKEVT
jgi:hypothetical protein